MRTIQRSIKIHTIQNTLIGLSVSQLTSPNRLCMPSKAIRDRRPMLLRSHLYMTLLSIHICSTSMQQKQQSDLSAIQRRNTSIITMTITEVSTEILSLIIMTFAMLTGTTTGKSITFTMCTTHTLHMTITRPENTPTLKLITMIVSMSITLGLLMIRMSTVK